MENLYVLVNVKPGEKNVVAVYEDECSVVCRKYNYCEPIPKYFCKKELEHVF